MRKLPLSQFNIAILHESNWISLSFTLIIKYSTLNILRNNYLIKIFLKLNTE